MADLRTELQTALGTAYTIERELGGGGMSRVFVADETRLQRKVVVKVLSPELAQGFSTERFEREIRTAAALQQANIVPVLSAGEMNGLPFYTMPFVEGESLRARLGRGPMSVTEVIGVMRDVSKALAYAHRNGVVHRDIKPDNVLLSEGTAVVTDFGIAKAISAARTGAGATLTQLGTSIGTPAYMAPEQAAGDPDVDHRADIYSLGAMAYELLTGQHVFAGRTPQRMLAAHMSEQPSAVTTLRGDIPSPLADLVMQCLAKEPSQRPQSASDIVRVIETITSGGGMAAMPPVLLGGPGMFKRALGIYAAAYVVVAIVARAAIVGIGLPDWVFPGALIVMALGFPVILWTGYVQHVTRRAMTTTPTYTPGGTPSGHGTIATMALKAAPHVSWYRTARGGMYAMGVFVALIAVFMGLRAFGVGPVGSLFASGRLNQRDQLLLTDFRTTNTDSTLGRVVSDAVRAGLSTSSFTLVSPTNIVAALRRMQKEPTSRVDSAVAREIALREGYKAIIDGEVTGVTGGYIVTLRLVRADSAIELASFRETGDGPRGLIDAADKLARKLRSKAGESLRDVNATPPLAQATTSSLEALRKYSEGNRLNAVGDRRAVEALREAVALDSTFASGWNALGAMLSNYFGGQRAARDSALTQAYRFRDRVPDNERERIIARYFALGPGRDRARAIAAYQALLDKGDSNATLVNLGEALRTRREFARAESLNLANARITPGNGTALGNAVEMQLNQGKVDEAIATAERLRAIAWGYGSREKTFALLTKGDVNGVRALLDTVQRREPQMVAYQRNVRMSLALVAGRLNEFKAINRAPGAEQDFTDPVLEAELLGPTPQLAAQLDSAITRIRFAELSMADRPYLGVATALARMRQPQRARAMIARYRTEMTDTALLRDGEAELHSTLGDILVAEGKPLDAIPEYRRGDVGYDGAPAHECAPCLSYDLAEAFDAAGQADSAIVMYERYLATPYWLRMSRFLDPVRVPKIRERLGKLYEAQGNLQKAAENYRAFIDLWKNADPELQPRVAAAREKLRRMSLDAPRR